MMLSMWEMMLFSEVEKRTADSAPVKIVHEILTEVEAPPFLGIKNTVLHHCFTHLRATVSPQYSIDRVRNIRVYI